MMRLFLAALAMLLAAPVFQLNAQESVDISAVAEQVSSVDSERLLMGLNTPIPDDILAGPFADARPMEGQTLTEQRARFNDALEGISGSVVYTLRYSPVSATASPSASPSGSPVARAPQAIFSSSTLSYLVFSEPIDLSEPEAFASSIQAAMGSEAQEGTVEQITVNDAPAVQISAMTVVNAVELHAQWIAVPVGNVVVIGMVMTGSDSFVEEDFNADNEALVLSGIRYLETIVNE